MSIQEMFNKLDDSATLHNTFVVSWSETGRGFGQYRFKVLEDGRVSIDNECDPKEAIKRVLCHMVDNAVLEDETMAEIRARREKEAQND